MTNEQRADQILAENVPCHVVAVNRERLRDAIIRAQIEAANHELERRRALEQQIANIQAGGPIIVADKTRTLLKVWNAAQQRWFETSMIACGEVERTDSV